MQFNSIIRVVGTMSLALSSIASTSCTIINKTLFTGLLIPIAVPFERLNLNDTAMLVVDHQVGLINMVGDWDKTIFKNNILGHAGLAKLFNIPVVMTSSFQQGTHHSSENRSATLLI